MLDGAWNSDTAPADVDRGGKRVNENTVFKITYSSNIRVSCTAVVGRKEETLLMYSIAAIIIFLSKVNFC